MARQTCVCARTSRATGQVGRSVVAGVRALQSDHACSRRLASSALRIAVASSRFDSGREFVYGVRANRMTSARRLGSDSSERRYASRKNPMPSRILWEIALSGSTNASIRARPPYVSGGIRPLWGHHRGASGPWPVRACVRSLFRGRRAHHRLGSRWRLGRPTLGGSVGRPAPGQSDPAFDHPSEVGGRITVWARDGVWGVRPLGSQVRQSDRKG